MSPFEAQRLEALSCTELKNILVTVTMANPALNFNYMPTETSYLRIVSGQIYNDTPFVPRYFLHNKANYNLHLQITNLQITIAMINCLPLKWSDIKLKTNWH